MGISVAEAKREIDRVVAAGPFAADWDALRAYQVPAWYQDAKFGIFIHWGVYAVPAFGNEWYPRNMYRRGSPEFAHHVATYGPQNSFGYRDFIPQFTAEKFDPDSWAGLFRQAGAQFVVPVAEHHDGFAMYDSAYSEWTATRMGPRRDLIGELAAVVRRQWLVFGLASHRAEHWWFYHEGMTFPSDVQDPCYAGLYAPAQPETLPPNEAFLDDWLLRTCELVDRYQPQLVWFDWWIEQPIFRPYLQRFAAYFYNRGAEWGRGVAINYKHAAFPDGTAVFDVERGQLDDLRPLFWQTDTSVSKNSWGCVAEQDYKSVDDLVDDLVDIVSKNGALLLNIGPRADGTIPAPEEELLRGIGCWLAVNGEAIYGTRPWKVFGEGPTHVVAGSFKDRERAPFTGQDIRFTTRGEVLFAIALAWPDDGRLEDRVAGHGYRAVPARRREGRVAGQRRAAALVARRRRPGRRPPGAPARRPRLRLPHHAGRSGLCITRSVRPAARQPSMEGGSRMYEPTAASIRTHRAPGWFEDAKLGIFVHWGLYSVPGWAPTSGPLPDVIARDGWAGWFARNPYAEWYGNSIRIAGSPSAQYHAAHYGAGFAYEEFAPLFNAAVAAWDPAEWADLFAAAGARYAMLTTKHHDGFLLWPSAHPNPHRQGYQAKRDLVGMLTEAVRARGLRMGLYYSGGLDWTFNDRPILGIADLIAAVPQQPQYVAYANAHLRELIDRYAPAVLWDDIAYPAAADLYELFAYYYNHVPDGAINDRFNQAPPGGAPDQATEPAEAAEPVDAAEPLLLPAPPHFDFRTPEYTSYSTIVPEKWESTRGLGYSFGYNRNETPDNLLSATELIHSFVDIVSKNGNLLLNVGPMADGTIPAEQRERLLALGAWVGTNGPAIYGTRPWERAEGRAGDGVPVRFTRGNRRDDQAVYAILLGTPRDHPLLEGVAVEPGAAIGLLGHDGALQWEQRDAGLSIALPQPLPARLANAPAYAFRLPTGRSMA